MPTQLHVTQGAQVRALFDLVAQDYAGVAFFVPLGRALVGWAEIDAGCAVLDLGAGRGAVTRPVVESQALAGVVVVAVDFSLPMLKALGQDVADARVLGLAQMEAETLGFADASFDRVISGFCLNVVADPRRVLAEALRVLRPGGSVAISVPGPVTSGNRLQPYAELVAKFLPLSDTSRWSMKPPPDLAQTLAEVGFGDIAETTAEVTVSFESGESYLQTEMSHGFRGWVDALGAEHRAQFLSEAANVLNGLASSGPLKMVRAARLLRASRPTAPDSHTASPEPRR